MRRLLTASLLAGCSVVAVGNVTPAAACDMAPTSYVQTIEEQTRGMELVSLATVVAEHEPFGADRYRYDVDFTEIWKGEPLPNSSVVTQDTSCGFPEFDPGDEVLIMTSNITDEYFVVYGNQADAAAELREAIGPGATAETDPELFERVNTHPSPLLNPIGLLSNAIGQTLSTLRLLLGLG